MRGIKPSLALASLGVIGLALWAGAYVDQAGSRMVVAADRLLKSLDKEQAAQATFSFDSPQRLNWHFIPRPRQGPRQGLRTLADLEDRALRLVQALDAGQQKAAVVSPEAPRDVRSANTPQPPTDAAVGVAVEELNDDQKAVLRALVESYAADMP